jgi:hypothetical protein
MFLNQKFGYPESLDYTMLPAFNTLNEEQQKQVHDAFERGYLLTKHMGIKIALGTGHETAKYELEQILLRKPSFVEQSVPPSIFAGLDNC